ncbi:MAG: 3-oxoacyl-ACP reductase FabG [Kiritimatiellia bacterium]|nr:3-oxoacyl-ACP reductase FabG [Kiritimatiellia bacterium]
MKRALIIGGSRGIGKAIALRLARSGFDLWLTYHRNETAAREAQSEIRALGRDCEIFGFDAGDYEAVRAALEAPCEREAPDVLIYNSGIARDNLMVFMTREEWHDVLRTNLDGFYHVTKMVLFPMMREKRGRIIAITSTSGDVGQAGQVNYSAAKAGLVGAVKALAREVGRKNIFVNAVSPGIIETDMTADIPKDKVLPLIPLGRFGRVEDVAATVNFLCSEEQSYIQGQVIRVNGGLAI